MRTKNQKKTDMKVLLILSQEQCNGLRVIVRLHKKHLQERVEELLKKEKDKEAFNLICSQAEVDSYVPPGKRLAERPALTFVEDML